MSEQTGPIRDVNAARKALGYFTIMAMIAGFALFVLVVVVVIHYGFDNARPSEVWSPIHGVIFFVYVIATANLGFTLRWDLPHMIRIMLAGVVPLLPFYVERRVRRQVGAQLGVGDPDTLSR